MVHPSLLPITIPEFTVIGYDYRRELNYCYYSLSLEEKSEN